MSAQSLKEPLVVPDESPVEEDISKDEDAEVGLFWDDLFKLARAHGIGMGVNTAPDGHWSAGLGRDGFTTSNQLLATEADAKTYIVKSMLLLPDVAQTWRDDVAMADLMGWDTPEAPPEPKDGSMEPEPLPPGYEAGPLGGPVNPPQPEEEVLEEALPADKYLEPL